MNIISVKDASYAYKTYGDDGSTERKSAVDGATFDVEEGSFVALVGHNGCGKSTLAKLLNGLLTASGGSVEVLGMDVSDEKNIREIRKNVGMVFQNPDNQMVASIVEEDVAFGPENLAVPQPEIVSRVETALRQVDMTEYAKRAPHQLSGGQKQRIAIAGALAIRPKILILDEATAMLDPQGRKEVLSVARKLNSEGMTVLLITHFMEEALFADKVLVMYRGKIIESGTPLEIFRNRELVEKADLKVPRAVELVQKLSSAGFPVNPDESDAAKIGETICRLLQTN